jgi:small conductance mechanosensitive channel
VIRARTKTRPTQQWTVGREFNRRNKKSFDEQGISFAQRTVAVATAREAATPLADAVAAATAATEPGNPR